MLRHRVAVSAALLLLVPSLAQAQSRVQFAVSGFGGAAIPASDLVDVLIPEAGAIRFGHKTGWTAGGRAALWPTQRIGIEVEAAFLGSNVELVGILPGFAEDTTFNATIFVGSLNFQYAAIAPPLDPVALFVSAGVGLVSRGGDFFTDTENTSDVAGVLGVGLRYGFAPGWRFRVDVKDYISSFLNEALDQELAPAGGTGSKLQNDILLTAGIELYFNPGS